MVLFSPVMAHVTLTPPATGLKVNSATFCALNGLKNCRSMVSLIMALRTTFQPEAARGATHSYELRLGEVVVHVRVHKGQCEVARGALPSGSGHRERPRAESLDGGRAQPAEAVASGSVRLAGDAQLLSRFSRPSASEPQRVYCEYTLPSKATPL